MLFDTVHQVLFTKWTCHNECKFEQKWGKWKKTKENGWQRGIIGGKSMKKWWKLGKLTINEGKFMNNWKKRKWWNLDFFVESFELPFVKDGDELSASSALPS